MDYAQITDLVARFGATEIIQLTDRSSPPVDAIDDTVAQPALDAASAIVDGYVAAKYALPLVAVSPLLVEVTCDIARYRLYADQAPELVTARFKAAMETLRDIARGLVKIDAAGVEPPPRTDVIETSGNCRMFTRCSLGRD